MLEAEPYRTEAEVKRRLVEISQRVIPAADSSRIERRALVSFCDFPHIDTFVTDEGAEPGIVNASPEPRTEPEIPAGFSGTSVSSTIIAAPG